MALVELRETRAVPNRNDRRSGKFSGKDFVDFGFHRFVHRRRGFVEKQPIGLGQYRAGDRKALLLAAGKALRPIVLDIEFAGEIAELRATQRIVSPRRRSDRGLPDRSRRRVTARSEYRAFAAAAKFLPPPAR